MPPRYAPAIPLPPYAFVPGHGLPHPVTDPRGRSSSAQAEAHGTSKPSPLLAPLPPDPAIHPHGLAAALTADPQWLYALDLFNHGFYWESHEAWESFWHALGRTTPEARFVQGLIHLTAACVKVREGVPAGVVRHTQRARELLGDLEPFGVALGLDSESITAVVTELERYAPECWHTSRTPVVRVLVGSLRLAE